MFDWVDLYGAMFEGRPLKDQLKDWLYEDNWSKEKLDEYHLLNSFPIVNDYMDYLLDSRSTDEYLSRYQMDYSDIHDPRKLRSTSSGTRLVRSGINFVSSNVKRLYR